MNAKEIMREPAFTVLETDHLESVASKMMENDIGSVVVVDKNGNAVGIITESEFLGHEAELPFSTFRVPKLWGKWVGVETLEDIYASARSVLASKVMNTPLVSVKEDTLVEQVAELMLHHHVKHVPVLRDKKPIGMISRHDLLRHFHQTMARGKAAE